MTTFKKILISISILIFITLSFYFSTKELPYEEGLFTIQEGQTLKLISQNLKEEGFIRNSNLFYVSLYLTNNPKAIKAGVYQLNSEMGIQNIINKIIKGETLKEKITIIEGWTISEIATYLEDKGLFKKEDFELATDSKELENEFEFLKYKPENNNLEGYLFPDTYYIEKDDTPETIIKKMLSNFETKVWNEIEDKENFYNTLIIASILEKEVTTFEDKQLVTDILLKRLEIGMALQLDATVFYANNLETFDLEIDSPYNTYKYPGLPIGPISNPGIESIEAALDPIQNNYWYYLSTEDGTIIFSKNFEEHKANTNIYLR